MAKKTSALHEKDGVIKPNSTQKKSIDIIKKKRAKKNSVEEYVNSLEEEEGYNYQEVTKR